MRIINKALLRTFRSKACEHCHRPGPCDAAHVFSRGAGRLDIAINLCSLCRGWHKGKWVSCHQDYDEGRIPRERIVAIVAAREGITPDELVAEIQRLRRLDKWGREPHGR